MKGLTEGRMVHFVTPSGTHRPAIIVRVWDVSGGCEGYVNLQVITDGSNDLNEWQINNIHDTEKIASIRAGLTWETSVCFDENGQIPRTWHWIEPA